MSKITVTHPLYITLVRKTKPAKKIFLSRNVWDVTHHRVKTQVKARIREHILPQLTGSSALRGRVSVSMKLYSSNYNCDLANFCDVLSKICQDTLVSQGLMVDDNVRVITKEYREFEGVDKSNPRLEIMYTCE